MSSNSPLSAIEQEAITSQGEEMSFELENPEIAGIVALYKEGQIAYQDAKNAVVRFLFNDINYAEYKLLELEKKAKELLLGKEQSNVQHDSQV